MLLLATGKQTNQFYLNDSFNEFLFKFSQNLLSIITQLINSMSIVIFLKYYILKKYQEKLNFVLPDIATYRKSRGFLQNTCFSNEIIWFLEKILFTFDINWSKLTSQNLGMEEVKATINLEITDENRTERGTSQWKKWVTMKLGHRTINIALILSFFSD